MLEENVNLINTQSEKNMDFGRFISEVKIGAIYNSFYDLELLETSIISIRPVVKYIAIVHQTISCLGELHSDKNKDILTNLVKIGLVDDVIYFDNGSDHDSDTLILKKRNIGLELCKKNECQYVMPMDNDECYNSDQLFNEIKYMVTHDISTLYSKIFSYWKNTNYYFEDTYLVPSVYKIDERKFEMVSSSVLCDPQRKMIEKIFYISEMPMHHLTYMDGNFKAKGVSNLRLRNTYYKDFFKQILTRLESLEEGDKALVFANDFSKNGELYMREVNLIKTKK